MPMLCIAGRLAGVCLDRTDVSADAFPPGGARSKTVFLL